MQLPDPSVGANAPQPGWYPDPWQLAPRRWWDGISWTGFTNSEAAPAALPTTPPTPLPTTPAGGSRLHAAGTLPAARDDIRGGGIAILGYFGALALALIFGELTVAFGAAPLSLPVVVVSEFGLWTGLCMSAYIACHRRPGGTVADLGFHMPTGHELGIGIGIGFLGLLIATRVTVALRHWFPDNGGSHLFVSSRPSFAAVCVFGALACIGAPIVEELFFRGLVQSVLMRTLGTTPAVVMQAVVFGLAHFELGMTFNEAAVRCGTVMVLGLFLGWLRYRTGRLGAGMAAHATNNLVVTLITLVALGAR